MSKTLGYIFDLDGTVYLGDQLIEGADTVINYLQQQGKRVLFLTNKTIESREKYADKLQRLNIQATIDNILNPTVTLINYLKEHHPTARLYVIGEQIIKDEIANAGFHFAEKPDETDMVIISWDRDFHYDHLNFAYQAVKHGAKMIATNPDRTCPMEDGDVPDCAGMIGALEGVTGKTIDLQIGKPSVITIDAALDILGLQSNECVMIGDRIETDILMGNDAGMKTILVLSGISTLEDVKASLIEPDYVISSIKELMTNEKLETVVRGS